MEDQNEIKSILQGIDMKLTVSNANNKAKDDLINYRFDEINKKIDSIHSPEKCPHIDKINKSYDYGIGNKAVKAYRAAIWAGLISVVTITFNILSKAFKWFQ